MMDRQIVIKLLSGEELVCTFIQETDYEISVIFPMLVKHMPKMAEGRILEAISLAPYSHFVADDEFTFFKSHIIYCKELHPKHIQIYNTAIEDQISINAEEETSSVDDFKKAVDELKSIFGNKIDDSEFDYDEMYDEPPSKLIH